MKINLSSHSLLLDFKVYGEKARIQWSQFGEFAIVAKAEVFDEHMQHYDWPMELVYVLPCCPIEPQLRPSLYNPQYKLLTFNKRGSGRPQGSSVTPLSCSIAILSALCPRGADLRLGIRCDEPNHK